MLVMFIGGVGTWRRKFEVHHKEFRSQSGDDCEQNLITLCSACLPLCITA